MMAFTVVWEAFEESLDLLLSKYPGFSDFALGDDRACALFSSNHTSVAALFYRTRTLLSVLELLTPNERAIWEMAWQVPLPKLKAWLLNEHPLVPDRAVEMDPGRIFNNLLKGE